MSGYKLSLKGSGCSLQNGVKCHGGEDHSHKYVNRCTGSRWLQTVSVSCSCFYHWNAFISILLLVVQTNTFQGILITDGSLSYTVFTYHCGSMMWSGSATIGFSADDAFFQSHPLSRTTTSNTIACLNSPDSGWNNLVYQLGGKPTVVPQPTPSFSASKLKWLIQSASGPRLKYGGRNDLKVSSFVLPLILYHPQTYRCWGYTITNINSSVWCKPHTSNNFYFRVLHWRCN